MKKIKMASPLYILRNECEQDLSGVLKKLAQIGFDGIEFLGFFGHSAAEVKQMLLDNGLENMHASNKSKDPSVSKPLSCLWQSA